MSADPLADRALNAAIAREQAETLASLSATYVERGGLPDKLLFSHDTIRALVRSAFRAGVFYERSNRDVGAERDALRTVLTTIADGDVPRPVGVSWWPDKRLSKHDKCVHGAWMYDECCECVSAFARSALARPTPEGEKT